MKYNQPYGVSDPQAAYINGNPATGTMGSIPPAEAVEFDQREIVNVIQYAHDQGLVDFTSQPCAQPSNGDLQQLLKAIFGMTRLNKLQADTTVYINSSTGDDSLGNGSTVAPYRTYQTAVNNAQARIDLNQQHTITFHGTGAFTNPVSPVGASICSLFGAFAGQAGAPSVVFDNTNATFNAVNGSCFWISSGAQCTVIGGSYVATWDHIASHTGQGCAFIIGGGGSVTHWGGTFNGCDSAHWFNYGEVQIVKPYTIAGNAQYHIVCEPQAVWGSSNGPFNIALSGTPNFSGAFASIYGGSVGLGGFGASFTGSATGKKFIISGFGTLYTSGNGVNFPPGNQAGTIAANTGNGELV